MVSAITPIAIPQARSAELDSKVIRRLASGAFPVFQLDATAYPGNSGSPIYDPESGEVLGIVNMVFVKGTKETALTQPSGITYAVPSKHLKLCSTRRDERCGTRRERVRTPADRAQVMPDVLWLKALLKAVILPPAGPLLVAIFGLALGRRFPRTGRALAVAGVASLLLLSLPIIAIFLLDRLETYPPLDLAQAKSAQAIVILGGGVRRRAPEYGGDTLGPLTLERVRYGARVARLTALPVLVSGGVTFGATQPRLR